MNSTKKILCAIAIILLLSFTLAACGSSNSSSSDNGSSSSDSSSKVVQNDSNTDSGNSEDVDPYVDYSATRTSDDYVKLDTSNIFHYANCYHIRGKDPDRFVYYKTAQDAIDDGNRPCKDCNP